MINVKLIVLVICIDIVFGNTYCEICSNHTLCKYTMPGPAVSCQLYDNSAVLSDIDIGAIVNKLNERRNYVAMGYSKFLPAAANMRKIRWSEELATFAQRWADQCDQSMWPDQEDQCRNTKAEAVSQNIATIVGVSSPFNVKSFIDTWFIRILDYSGSITYYNQSRDSKTKHFTQIIWANTSLVGCGRARFYMDHKNSMADRLVCNFSPQGNVHGKPVYTIGIPATQCPDNTVPDDDFRGLCRYIQRNDDDTTFLTDNELSVTTTSPKVSSLLRILNLSNSSKQAIDPIRNTFKPAKPNANMTVEQRYQKIRHIENYTYGGLDVGENQFNVNPSQYPNFKYNQNLMPVTSDLGQGNHHQERGHSRVYHGHHLHKFEQITTTETTYRGFRRFNFMSETIDVDNNPDYRKYYRNFQCTRKEAITPCNTERYYPKVQCTRGPRNNCDQTQPSNQYQGDLHREHCPCNIQKSSCSTPVPIIPTKCMCNVNCQCPNINYPTTRCPDHLRMQQTFMDETRKSATNSDYYDHFANIGIRNGEKNIGNRNNFKKSLNLNNLWEFMNLESIQSEGRPMYTKKYYHGDSKRVNDYKDSYDDNTEHKYKKPDQYPRHRRDLTEELTLKPFWQMDESSPKSIPELKSLRYTTLSNRRNKVSYRKPLTITESITIRLSGSNELNRKIVTEKYLSFDELMHLRKFGEAEMDVYGARRTTKKAAATTKPPAGTTKPTVKTTAKAGATTKATVKTTAKVAATTKATTKPTSKPTTKTSEITANTPFERKKHCTRKLTCTWTAPTVTGADGSVIGGMELEVGSLTPSGYVDGCTRTSTCTRVFMNRNKFSTIGIGDDDHGEEGSGEELSPHGDEDYCEKRALDIRRRETNSDHFNDHTTFDDVSQVSSPSLFNDIFAISTEKNHYIHSHEPIDCTCKDISRVKRNEIYNNDQNKIRETLSYGDLYYRVLQKIISGWRKYHPSDKHKCACNCGPLQATESSILIIIFNYLVI